MIKLLTIVGARPQIIKAAALSRSIKNHYVNEIHEVIVHTGQHYDENMSEVFFKELSIPNPDFNLEVGSGNHGEQTAQMIAGIEKILLKEKPDFIVLYGDTNSTLAGAIAASKLLIPIIHIEAGLRSFNKSMPEEINRIVCDHCSTLLISPTNTGIQNLENEGFDIHWQGPYDSNKPGIFHCGDIMYDNSVHFRQIAEAESTILSSHSLLGKDYILCTIHRNNNTDNPDRLEKLLKSISKIAKNNKMHLVIPMHPRTKKMTDQLINNDWSASELIHILPPASFLDMIKLEANSKLILTDSGGVQKEAYFFRKPCIILRPETEWVEIIESGTAVLADADPERIENAFEMLMQKEQLDYPPVFGDGKAANSICELIIKASAK